MALGAIGFQFTSPCAISIPDKFLKKKFVQVRCKWKWVTCRKDKCVFWIIDGRLSFELFLCSFIYWRKINYFRFIDFGLWVWGFRVQGSGFGVSLGACRPLTVCERGEAGSTGSEGSEGVVRRIKTGKRREVLKIWYSRKMRNLWTFWTFRTRLTYEAS